MNPEADQQSAKPDSAKKIERFVQYTAPAMLAMLTSNRAVATS
jgi:hypothetical protein